MATASASQNSDASTASAGLPPSLKTTVIHSRQDHSLSSTRQLSKGELAAMISTRRISDMHQRITYPGIETSQDRLDFNGLHAMRAGLSADLFPDPFDQDANDRTQT